jgi:hypothetical protein
MGDFMKNSILLDWGGGGEGEGTFKGTEKGKGWEPLNFLKLYVT